MAHFLHIDCHKAASLHDVIRIFEEKDAKLQHILYTSPRI